MLGTKTLQRRKTKHENCIFTVAGGSYLDFIWLYPLCSLVKGFLMKMIQTLKGKIEGKFLGS